MPFRQDFPGLEMTGELSAACEQIRAAGASLPQLDYTPIADRLGEVAEPVSTVCELAYQMSLPGQPDPLFPHLAGHPLLDLLLKCSREISVSPVTRLFQQYAIGSQAFEENYHLPVEVTTELFLRLYDRPQLDLGLAARLLHGWHAGTYHLAVYTARPSTVRDIEPSYELAFAPEAEMVLDLVGLEEVPLVGLGQVNHISSLTGQPSSQIMKPSIIQALGAIGAAVTRDEIGAMVDAARWAADPQAPGLFGHFPPLDIVVFEDLAGSIRAVRQAGEMLSRIGIQNRVIPYGISGSPLKIAALRAAGAIIMPDINQAVFEVVGTGG